MSCSAIRPTVKNVDPDVVADLAAERGGEMADVDWSDAELAVPYDSVPETGEWLIATGAERALIERLARECLRLDDPLLTTAIFQGLITSLGALRARKCSRTSCGGFAW